MCKAGKVNDLEANLQHVQQRIVAACEAAGRSADEVRLLPVSKTKPASMVRELADAGMVRFGENRVQEARDKARELSDVPNISWSIIGHLQTNKAKFLPEFAAEFQALDSIRLATELNERFAAAGRSLDVLIEVNSSGEAAKFGVPPEDVVEFAAQLSPFEALQVRGLMTIAEREVPANSFSVMVGLRTRLRDTDGLPGSFDELSMGMSGDFETAIAHGATCVRVGTAVFGHREGINPI